MRLPYPSPDDGQMIWCSLGELAAASAEAWTAGLFAAVVQLDHVDNDYLDVGRGQKQRSVPTPPTGSEAA